VTEISIVIAVLVALAIAYLFVYPKFSQDNVSRMAWLDIVIGVLLLGVLAPFNWGSADEFTFFTFDTSWWIFTILVYAVLELPLFYLYVKARGLGAQYRALFTTTGGGFTQTASVKSVEKQLSDTKWDGLRTPGALKTLVIGANLSILIGTVFLFNVGDNPWASLVVVHFLFIFLFWFLLRQAVRLIPDAPELALDERMLQERNSTYYRAYQVLFGISGVLAGLLLGYTIASDFLDEGDGFNYELNLTWPQINAVFWLVYGYAYMLPSMVMAWREYKRLTRNGARASS
jgi:hypothetical protein